VVEEGERERERRAERERERERETGREHKFLQQQLLSKWGSWP
jgi:hypothetical protein